VSFVKLLALLHQSKLLINTSLILTGAAGFLLIPSRLVLRFQMEAMKMMHENPNYDHNNLQGQQFVAWKHKCHYFIKKRPVKGTSIAALLIRHIGCYIAAFPSKMMLKLWLLICLLISQCFPTLRTC
jgi:hypothetical protein